MSQIHVKMMLLALISLMTFGALVLLGLLANRARSVWSFYHEWHYNILTNSFHYCVDIDDCASFPCQNNATCRDEIDEYTCVCVPGYTGELCEIGR